MHSYERKEALIIYYVTKATVTWAGLYPFLLNHKLSIFHHFCFSSPISWEISRKVMQDTNSSHIGQFKFPTATFLKHRRKEVKFISRMYFIFPIYQKYNHVKWLVGYFTCFLSHYIFEIRCGLCTPSTSPFRPARFEVLSSHTWVVATILDSRSLSGQPRKMHWEKV